MNLATKNAPISIALPPTYAHLAVGLRTAPARQPHAVAADIGLNPLALRFIATQFLVALAGALLAWRLGISFEGLVAEKWTVGEIGALVALWCYLWLAPGRRGSFDCRFAEFVFLLILMLAFAVVGTLTQYPALALSVRYADPWLARADAMFGMNVVALAGWTAIHPIARDVLTIAYASFAPQCLLTVLGLSILKADRDHLWEYIFNLHVFLVVMPISLALLPSVCAQAYYRFMPTLDMTHAVDQIRAFHDAHRSIVQITDMDGLISFPSFHAGNAILVTWAWRRHPWIAIPIVMLNACLVAATFVTGIHYFIDSLGALALCAVGVFLYRRYGAGWLTASE